MVTKTIKAAIVSVAVASAAPPLLAEPTPLRADQFETFDPAQVKAGWLLFYDPVISGNRNISCGSCHHPRFGTSDGQSLGMGEGGLGLGPDRVANAQNMPEQRIPRNSPALFNLGHKDLRVLFHDGRIEVDPTRPSGLRTPLGEDMARGFASLLSAQTMFPVLSPDEMAGHYQENDVSKAVRQGRITGAGGAWDIIASRVDALPEYRDAFAEFDPEIAHGKEIDFTDISDAVAAFMAVEWRADQTQFDKALRGEITLPLAAQRGQDLFFGPAGCADCHSGPLLSDQSFHAMAAPQLGPGKAARFETHQRDEGRMRVTGNPEDAYAFRTPMLRNVVHTGPWGHAGGHTDLGDFLRYHADPARAAQAYQPQAVLADLPGSKPDWTTWDDSAQRQAITQAAAGHSTPMSEAEIADILAFLTALSDDAALDGRLGLPPAVPSGLTIDR